MIIYYHQKDIDIRILNIVLLMQQLKKKILPLIKIILIIIINIIINILTDEIGY